MIALDTHVWVWWLSNPSNLAARAREAVGEAAAARAIYIRRSAPGDRSLVVGRAVNLHHGSERLDRQVRVVTYFHFVPVDNAIAVRSVHLKEPFHKDPADRIIVAAAITMGACVVSSDAKILSYPHVKSIWA